MNINRLLEIKKILSASIFALALNACSGDQDIGASVASHMERSKAYSQQGQYRAAIIEARNIIKKAPESAQGYEQLATIYNVVAGYKGVIATLDASPEGISSTSLLLKAQAYGHVSKFSSAASTLQQYQQAGGNINVIDAQLLQVKILANQQNLTDSKQLLAQVMANTPNNAAAENLLTQMYLQENKPLEAEESIDQTLSHSPTDPETLFLSALLAYSQNNLEKSEQQLTNALFELPETDIMLPIRSATLKQLSKVLTEQGRTSEALIYAKLLAEANPEATQANKLFQQALALIQAGKLNEAELHLKELNKTHPPNQATALYLGLINSQKGA